MTEECDRCGANCVRVIGNHTEQLVCPYCDRETCDLWLKKLFESEYPMSEKPVKDE